MSIDPALKGTRFGEALEAAARDAERKRLQRESEKNGRSNVVGQSRRMAEELRGHSTAPKTEAPTTPSQYDKRREWALQSNTSTNTPTETFPMTQPSTHTPSYSEAQINILALGAEADNARVPRGTVTKRLFDEGLIVRTTEGRYRTTEKGIAVWMTAKTIASTDTSPNSSPAPQASTVIADTPTSPAPEIEIAALRLQLQQAMQTADDRKMRVEDLLNRIEELKQEIERLTRLMEQGGDTKPYLEKIHALEQRIEELTAIKGDGRNNVGEALEYYMNLIAPVVELMQQDGYAERLMGEYVANLHAQDKRWREFLIDPLIDLIVADGAAIGAGEDVRNDPVFIMRFISLMHQNLTAMTEVADERLKQIENHETTIESLRRQLEQMTLDLQAGRGQVDNPQHEINAFLACVLDELAQQVPEVEAYRKSRVLGRMALRRLQGQQS